MLTKILNAYFSGYTQFGSAKTCSQKAEATAKIAATVLLFPLTLVLGGALAVNKRCFQAKGEDTSKVSQAAAHAGIVYPMDVNVERPTIQRGRSLSLNVNTPSATRPRSLSELRTDAPQRLEPLPSSVGDSMERALERRVTPRVNEIEAQLEARAGKKGTVNVDLRGMSLDEAGKLETMLKDRGYVTTRRGNTLKVHLSDAQQTAMKAYLHLMAGKGFSIQANSRDEARELVQQLKAVLDRNGIEYSESSTVLSFNIAEKSTRTTHPIQLSSEFRHAKLILTA